MLVLCNKFNVCLIECSLNVCIGNDGIVGRVKGYVFSFVCVGGNVCLCLRIGIYYSFDSKCLYVICVFCVFFNVDVGISKDSVFGINVRSMRLSVSGYYIYVVVDRVSLCCQ